MNKKQIVLLGIGHTNAHVVKQWATDPIEHCDLVCISKFPAATYSGMLPGTLGHQFREDEMQIDLAALTERAGAKLILSDTRGLDLGRREIILNDHEPVSFDALSIGVGSMPSGWQQHRESQALVPIKPMQTFLSRLTSRLQAIENPDGVGANQAMPRATRVAIVGGGVASVEIAFCLFQQLRKQSPELPFTIEIFTNRDHVAAGMTRRSVLRIERLLAKRGILVHHNRRVDAIKDHAAEKMAAEMVVDPDSHYRGQAPFPKSQTVSSACITTDDGISHGTDCVIWATNAAPLPLLKPLGLTLDSSGFIATRRTLQSVSDPRIFAVGDCGTVVDSPSPKAGVYAVRQSPILWHNLRALIAGTEMQSFHPQADFLKLLNTGDGKAFLEYRWLSVHASWCWSLKTWIDKRFITEFQ